MTTRSFPLLVAAATLLTLSVNLACEGDGEGGSGGSGYPPVGGSGGRGGSGGSAGSGPGGSGGTGMGGGGTGGEIGGMGGGGTGGDAGGSGGGGSGGEAGPFLLRVTGSDLASIDGTQTGLAEAFVAVTDVASSVRVGLTSQLLDAGSFDVSLSNALAAGESYRVDVLIDLTAGEGSCDRGEDFLFSRTIGPVTGDEDVAIVGTDPLGTDDDCEAAFPPPPPLFDLQVDASGFPRSAVPVRGRLFNVSSGGTPVGVADTTVAAASGSFQLAFSEVLGRDSNYELEVWIDEDGSGTCEATDLATEVRTGTVAWPDIACTTNEDCLAGMTCIKAPPSPDGTCGPLPNPIRMEITAADAGRTGCDRFP